jgi:hypothetical protein
MYPSIEKIKKDVLENKKETRPFVLCEYTHAMGNSCGDIADYWKLIYNNEQCMGAFVWEWADHGIKTKKGFLYGGDFGEKEHDNNFCCDGLLTPDRKLKTAALEMKAVYGGKLESKITEIEIPKTQAKARSVEIAVDEFTGCLNSIIVDGKQVLKTPMKWNVLRYTDNDRRLINKWNYEYRLPECKPEILSFEKVADTYVVKGLLVANCIVPIAEFMVKYAVQNNSITIETEYQIANHINTLPRLGFEFGIDKKYDNFSFVGFGKTESYVDKHVACEYGYFKSNAKENYDYKYIRPQESGSHYASKYLCVTDLFELTAQKPFSFSINPYTTKQLYFTKHNSPPNKKVSVKNTNGLTHTY